MTIKELKELRKKIDKQIKELENNERKSGRATLKCVNGYHQIDTSYVIQYQTNLEDMSKRYAEKINKSRASRGDEPISPKLEERVYPIARGETVEDCICKCEEVINDLIDLIAIIKSEEE